MKLTEKEIETLRELQYINFLDRCLKKNKVQIIGNRYGFVRGIPHELANDMFILAMNKIDTLSDIETLKRLKFICEYFISQKSNRRKSYDSPRSKTKVIIDKFTIYESQLQQIESQLKNC
nr:hypothetical protein [uncultured Draconibacterium sp.]